MAAWWGGGTGVDGNSCSGAAQVQRFFPLLALELPAAFGVCEGEGSVM